MSVQEHGQEPSALSDIADRGENCCVVCGDQILDADDVLGCPCGAEVHSRCGDAHIRNAHNVTVAG